MTCLHIYTQHLTSEEVTQAVARYTKLMQVRVRVLDGHSQCRVNVIVLTVSILLKKNIALVMNQCDILLLHMHHFHSLLDCVHIFPPADFHPLHSRYHRSAWSYRC